MIVDSEIIRKYITELCFTNTLEEHFEVFEKFIRLLGYDGGTYTYVPQLQIEAMKELPAVFLSTEGYPMAFLEQYTAERLDQNDFTIRKIQEGKLEPMDWRYHELHDDLSRKELGVLRLAREKYGIKNGISIPLMLEAKGGAGVSLISYAEDAAFQPLKDKTLDTLVSMSRLLHEKIANNEDLSHKFIFPVLESLTNTEITILTYKASGQAMKSLEESTGISSSYAANVLGGLRKRMGGLSTDRLMYLLGLLNAFNVAQEK